MKKFEVVIRESCYRTIEVYAENMHDGIDHALLMIEEMRPLDDPGDHAEIVAIEEAGWKNK